MRKLMTVTDADSGAQRHYNHEVFLVSHTYIYPYVGTYKSAWIEN